MDENESQSILFFLGFVALLLGYRLAQAEKTCKVILVFCGTAMFIVTLAGIGPYTIKTFFAKLGKQGVHMGFERHQDTKEEKEFTDKYVQDNPPPEIEEKGKKFVEEVKERPPEKRSARNYLVLATNKWREKKYDEALQDVYAGLVLKPDDTRLRAKLIHRKASIFDYMGLKEQAVKFYKEAIQTDQNFSWPHHNLGNLYGDQKKWKEGEAEFKAALKIAPRDAEIHSNFGAFYGKQGKVDKEKMEYEKAIKFDPEYLDAHFNLGALYGKQGKLEEAEAKFKEIIKLDPKYADAHLYLGIIYKDLGKEEEAEAKYREALKLDPNNLLAHNNLGNLYEGQEKFDLAKKQFARALKIDPNDKDAKAGLERVNKKLEE